MSKQLSRETIKHQVQDRQWSRKCSVWWRFEGPRVCWTQTPTAANESHSNRFLRSHRSIGLHLFRDVILKVCVAVAYVGYITRKADNCFRLFSYVPQYLRNRIPHGHDLLGLGGLQKLLKRNRFLLRPVVKDEILNDESLDNWLKTSRSILWASNSKRILRRVMTISDAGPCPFPINVLSK